MNALDALQIANDVRGNRAQLKRGLRAGEIRLQSVLLDPPAWAHAMRVADVLEAMPKFSTQRVKAVMARLQIKSYAELGSLSAGRCIAILDDIEGRYPRVWADWEDLWAR